MDKRKYLALVITLIMIMSSITSNAAEIEETLENNQIETVDTMKSELSQNIKCPIYHQHTGKSTNYGECYTKPVPCRGENHTYTEENMCHGGYSISDSGYQATCKRCNDVIYNSANGGFHSFPPGQCSEIIDSYTYTQCIICGHKGGDGSCQMITSYDLNCNKSEDTILAYFMITKSTDKWAKSLNLIASFDEVDDTIQINEKPFIWNEQEATTNEQLTITENGIYSCQLNADENSNTMNAKITIQINHVDNIPPAIETVSYNQVRFQKHAELQVIAQDKQEDGFALDNKGSGLSEEAYSFDNKNSWNSSNKFMIQDNGVYQIAVKDQLDNTIEHRIFVNNIDNQPPTIITLETNTKGWTNSGINIKIKAEDYHITPKDPEIEAPEIEDTKIQEIGIGLAKAPYSWDEGKTWVDTNTYHIRDNGTYKVMVRDVFGNQKQESITIQQIDKEPPQAYITSNPENGQWIDGKCLINIVAKDKGSGLSTLPYSWDEGKTWTTNHTLEILDQQKISVWARDAVGNKKNVTLDIKPNGTKKVDEIKEEVEDKVKHIKEGKTNNTPQINQIAPSTELKDKHNTEKKVVKNIKEETSDSNGVNQQVKQLEKDYTTILMGTIVLLIMGCGIFVVTQGTVKVNVQDFNEKQCYHKRHLIRKREGVYLINIKIQDDITEIKLVFGILFYKLNQNKVLRIECNHTKEKQISCMIKKTIVVDMAQINKMKLEFKNQKNDSV